MLTSAAAHPASLDFDSFLAIADLKASYFYMLDTKQWDRLFELFTHDARFEGFAFDVTGSTAEFVAVVSAFLAGVRSQHQGSTPRFRLIRPGHVRGIWTMRDYLTWEPGSRVYKGIDVPGMHGIRGYGYYEEEYTHTADGWRISFSRLVRTRIDALVGPEPVTPGYDVHGPTLGWLE